MIILVLGVCFSESFLSGFIQLFDQDIIPVTKAGLPENRTM